MPCSIIAFDIHSVSIISIESATAIIWAAVSPEAKVPSSSIGAWSDKMSCVRAWDVGGKELASSTLEFGGFRTSFGNDGNETGAERHRGGC